MAKQQTTALENNIVEVKTVVTYKGESLESALRINADDITNQLMSTGAEATNKSIASALQALYTKTNDNFKDIVNK